MDKQLLKPNFGLSDRQVQTKKDYFLADLRSQSEFNTQQ